MRHPHQKRPHSGGSPDQRQMHRLLKQGGVELNPPQLELLWQYHNLLRQRNHDRDLTRIINFEAMVIKHYLDCMIIGNFWKIPSPLVDIGTGAGFPGIPLKIRYPHLEITLAEPRPNRVQFLNDVISHLRLKHISVFDHKVASRSFQKPVRAAITRALETIDKTALRTSACLGKGDQLILLKGPAVDPELIELEKRLPGAFKIACDRSFSLLGGRDQRRLIVLEKLIPAEKPSETPLLEESRAPLDEHHPQF